jgi:uncharacterized protein YecE (DUF72 family)
MKHPPPRIGTAGWSIASRYADELPPGGSHLERYARRFDTAEINSSFYKPHQHKTYARWADSTPAKFRFAVKLPKAITHEHRLEDFEAPLDRFLAEVAGLGKKFGVLLVQLPPKLEFVPQIAGRFFDALRARTDVPVACEPRHAGWFTAEADAWLAARRVARVAADPARIDGAGAPGGWRGLVYYRWHGAPRVYYSDYDEAALTALAARLAAHRAGGTPCWCILDNTASGAALGNALTLTHDVS